MAVLQLNYGAPTQTYRLDRDRAVLGRHPDCDVVLDAAAVSRQHAQITRDNGEFYIEDLHSRNGTYVNGELTSGQTRLADGDRVKICDLGFTFYRQAPGDFLHGGPSALLVDDDWQQASSTIMSKIDLASSRTGTRLVANPETKLRAMLEISQRLGKAIELDDVLPKILDSLFEVFVQADRCFVLLRDAAGQLVPRAVKCRREELEINVRISRTITNRAIETREAILSADAVSDQRFEASQSIADLRIRSVMCAPLVTADGQALGAIQVDTLDQRQRFQAEDLEVLASVASQAANAIDNANLHENLVRQRTLERDLLLARQVQRELLPVAPPQVAGYHFFDFYEPARAVGGDYYDYITLPDGRLAVVLGDVSGKGMAAALVMAKLTGQVAYCLASEASTGGAMRRLNDTFRRNGWEDRFVTFLVAVLDPARNEMVLANAGHPAPFVKRAAGMVEAVGEDETGIPLGVDPDFQYEECTVPLAPGDAVLMFTDGISEAMNAQDELYGLARLSDRLRTADCEPACLGKLVLDDVRKFAGGHPQSDDMCVVCFGRGR